MKPGDHQDIENFLGWYYQNYGAQLGLIFEHLGRGQSLESQRLVIQSMIGQCFGHLLAVDRKVDPGIFENMKMSDFIKLITGQLIPAALERERRDEAVQSILAEARRA